MRHGTGYVFSGGWTMQLSSLEDMAHSFERLEDTSDDRALPDLAFVRARVVAR